MQGYRLWIACALPAALVLAAGCILKPMKVEEVAEPAAEPTKPEIAEVTELVTTASDAAIGKPVTASCPPNDMYRANGVKSLVDGRMGTEYHYDQEWMGWWYEEKPFEATIDLEQVVAIEELGVHVLHLTESWIFFPKSVEFELSKDGKNFEKVGTIKPTESELNDEYPSTKIMKVSNLGKQARYVRVRAERYGELPAWHLGHGGADGYEGEAWLFLDEILVNPKKK